MADPAPPGLRERKKLQTRLAISQVATRMFIERGFDRVTIAEVAEVAHVSVNTIFNYFTTKEELFFDQGGEVANAPSKVVRERRVGESAVDALHRNFSEAVRERTGAFRARNTFKPFLAAVEASPTLKSRARILFEQSEDLLVETLREETGASRDDPTARIVAAMVMSLYRVLAQEFQTRVLRGESDAKYRPALSRIGERGFELLHASVGKYAKRR